MKKFQSSHTHPHTHTHTHTHAHTHTHSPLGFFFQIFSELNFATFERRNFK